MFRSGGCFLLVWMLAVVGHLPVAAAEPSPPLPRAPRPRGLPPGALLRLGEQRFATGGPVRALAFSPDGKLLACSTLLNGATRLFDVTTGAERLRFPDVSKPGAVCCLAFSPDGRSLFACDGASVRLWDTTSGKERLYPQRQFPMGRQELYNLLALSADGKWLATATRRGFLRLWNTATGKEIAAWKGHFRRPLALLFAPDGRTLVSAGEEIGKPPLIRRWEIPSGKELPPLRGLPEPAGVLAFSPDGKVLASGGHRQSVRLWDAATGELLHRCRPENGRVGALAFLADGKTLLVATDVGPLEAWNTATGKLQRRLEDVGTAGPMVMAPGGKVLATGGPLQLWDVATFKELFPSPQPRSPLFGVAYTARGRNLVANDWGLLWLWEATSGKLIRCWQPSGQITWVIAGDPGGDLFASSGGDAVVRLWDGRTGKEVRCLRGHKRPVRGLAFAPDGKTLASAAEDHTARVWDVATGKQLQVFRGHKDRLWSATFSSDGQTLLTSSRDGSFRQWNVKTGKETSLIQWPRAAFDISGGLECPAYFLPDDRRLLTWGRPLQVLVWDTLGNAPWQGLGVPRTRLESAALSPDGRLLVNCSRGAGNGVSLWEVATGKQVAHFKGHLSWPAGVAFGPDGRTVASVGMDAAAFVWDVTGRLHGGKLQPAKLSSEQLKDLWADLAGEDAVKAQRAVWLLASDPARSVPLLRKHLLAPAAEDAKKLLKQVADLDSSRFAVRDRASAALKEGGLYADHALTQALRGKPSLEARQRIEAILKTLAPRRPDAEEVRRMRALTALEQARTPEAGKTLQELAKLPQGSWYRWEAEAALRRLANVDAKRD